MLFILVLLCAYFSVATLTETYPEGADAAEAIAAQLTDTLAGPVAAAAGDTGADAAFTERLARLLGQRDLEVTVAAGSPREVRAAFEKLLAEGKTPVRIFTTREAHATVARIQGNLLGLEDVPLVAPPSHTWPTFLKTNNLLNVANQIAVMAIVAAGMSAPAARGGDAGTAARQADLERSNAELQHFAEIVSHDLEEPLRTIVSYTDLLAARYGSALDDRGRRYLSHTAEGARRKRQGFAGTDVVSRRSARGLVRQRICRCVDRGDADGRSGGGGHA